ncbi:cytochrome P450 [Tengunoibacter tsumagoiensis]|uniref:Putative cytochrome P450 n=1 Tax=Tengunoibacter tsumagoiensis TaxID=2014871 RepID=A0A402A754_9CHLR|nr:cytochrome P450 [Tengunoibacter tsumagoiensis]GCE14928.1 putative cytochrome P450 [Tengunoibacter tsumagoiensis]
MSVYTDIPYVTPPADYQFHLGTFLADAYERYGPVFRSTYFEQDVLYMIGPEANRFVLVSNRQKFSNDKGWSSIFSVSDMFGRGLLTMDGTEHSQSRKMMNPAFTVNYMNHYLPLMNRVIRDYTGYWAEVGEIDIYEEARKITFEIAAQAFAGLRSETEIAQFRELFLRILMTPRVVEPDEDFETFTREQAVKLRQLQGELHTLLLPKIEERRKNPTNDLFGLLVQARDDQGNAMPDEQLTAHANILLVAGHETSTSFISWLLYLLVQHPDYLERVLAEQDALLLPDSEPTLEDIKRMKVLDNALKETERLYPPIPNGPRGLVEDIEFNGYHIPAGTLVFYAIAASHMIGSIFPQPTQFDPDRFAAPREEDKKSPYALVGFGGGPRMCIGLNFAQIEMKALLSHLLRRYRFDLVPGQEIAQFYAATGRPLNGIRFQVSKRA